MPTEAEVLEALRPVEDPEIHRRSSTSTWSGASRSRATDVGVTVALTVAGLPAAGRDHQRVTDAVVGARRRRRASTSTSPS